MPVTVSSMFCPTVSMETADPDGPPGIYMGPRNLEEDFVLRELLDPKWAELARFEDRWGLVYLDHPGALQHFQARARQFGDYPDIPNGKREWEKSALLREMRALSRQWIASQGDGAQGVIEAWGIEGFGRPQSIEDAWRRWAITLNGSLGRYRLTVSVQLGDWKWSPREQRETSHASVVTFCAVQLAEIASGGWRLLRCANANCGSTFTRQRTARRDPRSIGHTEGVRFCSWSCAKAQSERERRARNRTKTKGGV